MPGLRPVISAQIGRLAYEFNYWNPRRHEFPLLLVCEEAHQYIPRESDTRFVGTRRSMERIAKEGRKYGVGLLLVSQRPSEVEATVLSQCNSWIVLRITNDTDREHVRSILPDSMSGLTKMLSGLRRQEAIFVGQAAMLPSRILIRDLKPEQLPRSNDMITYGIFRTLKK